MSPYSSLTMRSSTEGLWQPWCEALTYGKRQKARKETEAPAQEGCGQGEGWGLGGSGSFSTKEAKGSDILEHPYPGCWRKVCASHPSKHTMP